MTIRVVREPTSNGARFSVWFVNGRFECFGLEDASGIPAGVYRVAVTDSVRFKRRLPILLDVPGFTGIRIHPGNTIADTTGCLLPGKLRGANRVGDSRAAFDKLFARMEVALAIGDAITLRLEPPTEGA